MTERPRDIAVIAAFDAPFIRDDVDFLSRHFRVRVQIGSGLRALWKIFWLVLRSDLIFCWFASSYAAFAVAVARTLSLRSIVVVGGVDVANEPAIGYGMGINRRKAKRVRFALRNAWKVLVVDPSLARDSMAIAGYDGHNILYLPTGYDPEFWKPIGAKTPAVLTVAAVDDPVRLKVKGIDLLIAAAKRLTEMKFTLIGIDPKLLASLNVPPNMTVLPRCARNELLQYYRAAKVYCQPSRREGLPNTLCEAMLCECIPVASDVGGNATAVGQSGFLVEPGVVDALVAALVRAGAAEPRLGVEARARIVALFHKEKRERDLLTLLGERAS